MTNVEGMRQGIIKEVSYSKAYCLGFVKQSIPTKRAEQEIDSLIVAVDANAFERGKIRGAAEERATVVGLDDGKDWAFWRSIMDSKECPHYAPPDPDGCEDGCLDRGGMTDCTPLDANCCRLLIEIEHLNALRLRRVIALPAANGLPVVYGDALPIKEI